MERAESSNSMSSNDDIWAKLEPLHSSYSDVELKGNEETISLEEEGASTRNRFVCKIIRQKDHVSALIINKSICSITINGVAVQPDDSDVITCGSEIILGPKPGDSLKYMFKVMPTPDCNKQLKISINPEHMKCSICLNVWHDVVTVAPCLHNFCNGCFSEWLKRCQEKHSQVLCPQCRADVQFVGRNHFLHTIEEDILLSDSSLRRSNEEIALMDSIASIKSPLVVRAGRLLGRKRSLGPEFEDDGADLHCPQCATGYGGFCCNATTVHLPCQACGGMMPFRSDAPVPQHCLGCDRAFCGAYWNAMGIDASYAVEHCSNETLKPISAHSADRIPFVAHEKNRHEQDITEKCIRGMGRSFQDVIAEWIRRFGNREIDRSRLNLNHAETITPQTYVCRDCYDKLLSFLLYWFRTSMLKQYLPPEAKERKDCWYGYACRTQHHNEDHARKRNHVCRPTRGTAFPS